MNKSDARRYAARLVDGFIERLFHDGKEPLVYDLSFDPSIQGRRLSPKDRDRVYNAVVALQERLPATQLIKGQPDGKPGPRWKGYESWLDKQGWRVAQ